MMVCSCAVGSDHPSRQDEHEDGCPLATEGATVLVFRNPATGQPVAVPEQIALEAERPFRAWKLLEQGFTWAQIAHAEGYESPGAAKYDVGRYMDEAKALVTDFSRREQLELDVQRLNTLQAVVWPQAMKGHLPAVKTVMDLIGMRLKAIGAYDLPAEVEEQGPRTVVVAGDRYIDQLREIAEGGTS